jgi:hypothetical protein
MILLLNIYLAIKLNNLPELLIAKKIFFSIKSSGKFAPWAN